MKDIIFVTAQPDVPYFHWQVKLYTHNFIEMGIEPCQIHVVFGLTNGQKEPSKGALELCDYGFNVHFYYDDRIGKNYIPSIKPYLISRWLYEHPQYGKVFFLHDADIIFRELPDFDKLMSDNVCYLSDTIGYIGYNYIMDCCKRYENVHPKSEKGQLLSEMAGIVGLDVDTIKNNQESSGGGQYLLKNMTYDLWEKIYLDCVPLYKQMHDYHKRHPISPGEIQFWTAEMWSLLWNLWLHNYETKVVDDLNFSWATDDIKIYEERPILHMAGVTDNLRGTKFYKGEYINVDPIEKLKENPSHFDYIEKNSTTIKYIEVMKSFIQKTIN
jgi:hypothetical protein